MKKIISLLLTTVMIFTFSTIAFAGAINKDNVANYKNVVNKATITQGTTSFEVTIGLEDTTGADIEIPANAGSYSYLAFTLSADAISAGIVPTAVTPLIGTAGMGQYVDGASGMIIAHLEFKDAAVTANKNTPLAKITFTAPSDVALGTYKMVVMEQGNFTTDGATGETIMNDWNTAYDFVTVTAAGPKVEATKDAETGVITVTGSETLKDKKILFHNVTATEGQLQETSRLVVTNGSKTKNYNIFAAVKAEGAGSAVVGDIAFGIVYTDDIAADAFTFELTNLVTAEN